MIILYEICLGIFEEFELFIADCSAVFFFPMRNIKKRRFSMSAFSFSASILHFIISWNASSDDWFAVANEIITSFVSYEVMHCFFVPMGGLEETSSLTNAGASLEMALKGWWVTTTEWDRGWGFGAKNCNVLAMFSLSSRLSHLMASWISVHWK